MNIFHDTLLDKSYWLVETFVRICRKVFDAALLARLLTEQPVPQQGSQLVPAGVPAEVSA
jgi:hypothetical protein